MSNKSTTKAELVEALQRLRRDAFPGLLQHCIDLAYRLHDPPPLVVHSVEGKCPSCGTRWRAEASTIAAAR